MKSTAMIEGAMPLAVERAGPRSAIREYTMPAKVFHWLTVALVFCMVASGVTATQLGEGAAYDVPGGTDHDLSASSLPGLTRQSIIFNSEIFSDGCAGQARA